MYKVEYNYIYMYICDFDFLFLFFQNASEFYPPTTFRLNIIFRFHLVVDQCEMRNKFCIYTFKRTQKQHTNGPERCTYAPEVETLSYDYFQPYPPSIKPSVGKILIYYNGDFLFFFFFCQCLSGTKGHWAFLNFLNKNFNVHIHI